LKTAIWLYLFIFITFFDLHAQYPILTPFAISPGAVPSFIGLIMGIYSTGVLCALDLLLHRRLHWPAGRGVHPWLRVAVLSRISLSHARLDHRSIVGGPSSAWHSPSFACALSSKRLGSHVRPDFLTSSCILIKSGVSESFSSSCTVKQVHVNLQFIPRN